MNNERVRCDVRSHRLYKKGCECLEVGRYKKAILCFDRVINPTNPNNRNGWYRHMGEHSRYMLAFHRREIARITLSEQKE